jgi:hypothetical protein
MTLDARPVGDLRHRRSRRPDRTVQIDGGLDNAQARLLLLSRARVETIGALSVGFSGA